MSCPRDPRGQGDRVSAPGMDRSSPAHSHVHPAFLAHAPRSLARQVRYSYNIWHTWGEAGLMSLFQTLREMHLLPIATVDPSGYLRELVQGGNASWDDASGLHHVAADNQDAGCPWTYDTSCSEQCVANPAK